jgi:hypothetical protein
MTMQIGNAAALGGDIPKIAIKSADSAVLKR